MSGVWVNIHPSQVDGGEPDVATIESHTGATTFSILGDGTNGEDGQVL